MIWNVLLYFKTSVDPLWKPSPSNAIFRIYRIYRSLRKMTFGTLGKCSEMFGQSSKASYNIARALVLSNSYCVIMVKIFMFAPPCSIKWRVQFYYSCKISLSLTAGAKASAMWTSFWTIQTLLRALDFCQAKMFTKAWVFWLILATFSSSILTLFAYIFINPKKRILHWYFWDFWEPDEAFSFNCCSTDCGVFLTRQQYP